MDVNQKKEIVQKEGLARWIINDKKGVIEAITGIGKTFLALKALYTMPRHSDLIHLFLAEQTDRERDLEADILKYNEIYDCDVHKDYNLKFFCYQTVRHWKNFKLGLVIADEIHDSMTPENYKFYINNKYNAIIGLTAKFDGKKVYTVKGDDEIRKIFGWDLVSKQEMLDKIAPICFTYTTNQGQTDGTARLLNVYIIETELDKVTKNIEAGNASTKFFQTEEVAMQYANKVMATAVGLEPTLTEDFYNYQERRNVAMFKASTRRCKLIYELPSKSITGQLLMKKLLGKTIVFGNSLSAVKKLTPFTVCSANTDIVNNSYRDMFDQGNIKTIGSFKKLKQGANLEKADNAVLMSYYSSEIDFIQRIGRLRHHKQLVGNVFILVSKGTQEEIWLEKMMTSSTNYKVVRGSLDDCIESYIETLKE